MIRFCYMIMYLIEGITCFIFFENSYNRKQEPDYWHYRVHITYPAVLAVNYAISFIGVPVINLVTFFLTTLFIAYFCYEIKLRSAMFMATLLSAFMLCCLRHCSQPPFRRY